MGQLAHPHPQEDLPFFLSRTRPAITTATTAISAAQIRIVAIFPVIHANILFPPVPRQALFVSCTFRVSLADSL